MSFYSSLILEALEQPPQKVGYFVTHRLKQQFPDKELFCVSSCSFPLTKLRIVHWLELLRLHYPRAPFQC